MATRQRAIAEALERWAWSKWIDEGFSLNEQKNVQFSSIPVTDFIVRKFDEVLCFSKNLSIYVSHAEKYPVSLPITLGKSGDGVFAGSRVAPLGQDLWTHALVESWRHMEYFIKSPSDARFSGVASRIHHFCRHGNEALALVNREPTKTNWPEPQMALLDGIPVANGKAHIWRALLKNFRAWHEGGAERFVY
ncbi:MAG: hypothetical protein NDI61_04405 [Bdellovibrionaceae bacterium]|nr:hypothetical protein [Pseudobdellovibrionaceae bacterium]